MATESVDRKRTPVPAAAGVADRAQGKAMRAAVSRSSQGELTVPDRDPVEILERQNESRLPWLVPVRIGRMLQSPFSYYRGTAATMAVDLAAQPVSGHEVVICGDAHISNFGLFASPERRLLFDLNDFDEVGYGPWEWDVKRMAASVHIGARDNGFTERRASEATEAAVRGYRTAIHQLAEMSALDRYYFQVDVDRLAEIATLPSDTSAVLRKTARKASRRTSDAVLARIVVTADDGTPRICDQPPLMEHVPHGTQGDLEQLVASYAASVRADTSLLLSQFTLRDAVLRVVGVGSVGTRCYVLLFEGPHGEPLFLQPKEAQRSVIETHGGRTGTLPVPHPAGADGNQGFRVVAGQRILQAQSDPFLGWITGYAGDHAERRPVDYYWRQFRDMKGSFDLATLSPSAYTDYVGLCARLLARAHSQSPGVGRIAGYLGTSDRFDRAVARWSAAYADQIERDFAALEHAVATGRLAAERDV